jgi:nucleoside-diphosphate-sugar epimerase|tara:strand:+ start:123 stop:1133 length:1011 start_codon:yes stop_codon:yes gene_type:complete
MRTVITGGCGFIGKALASHLSKTMDQTDELILVDTMQHHGNNMDADVLSFSGVKIVKANLADQSSLKSIPTPVDRVYHLSAILGVSVVEEDPIRVMKNNTLSTMHLLDWFGKNQAKGARFLFSSSSEVYSGASLAGFDLPIPTPENIPVVLANLDNPRFCYALTKIWGEAYCNYQALKNNVFALSVRYHNIYGPGMGYDHVIPQVILRILSKENPFRIIAPQQTRSFCWIDDAVKATQLVMESEKVGPGMVVHIGNEVGEIKIEKLYEMLFEICDWRPEEILIIQEQKGSVSRRCPDTEKLRQVTNYTPNTSLQIGIEKTVSWYKKQYNNTTDNCN